MRLSKEIKKRVLKRVLKGFFIEENYEITKYDELVNRNGHPSSPRPPCTGCAAPLLPPSRPQQSPAKVAIKQTFRQSDKLKFWVIKLAVMTQEKVHYGD
jgi:hypothetical protein